MKEVTKEEAVALFKGYCKEISNPFMIPSMTNWLKSRGYKITEEFKPQKDKHKSWCMCTEIKGVARDGFSTCMICGGIDAYGGLPQRGKKYKKSIIKIMNKTVKITN